MKHYITRYNRRNDSIRLCRMIRRIDSLSERLADAIYDYRMLRDAGVKGMKKGEHRMARDPEYVESLKGGGGGGHMSTGAKVATGLGAGALAAGALGAAFLGRRGMKGLAKAALRGAKSGLGSAKSGAKHALHSAKSGLSSAASKAKSGLSSVKSSLGTAEGRNNLKQRALIKGSHLKESLGNAYEGAKSTAKSTLNSLKTKEGREGLKQRARELKQRAQFAYGARAEKVFNKLENAAKKVPSAKQIRNKITSAASNVKSQAKNQAARLKNVAQQARTAEGRAELKNAFKKARQNAQIRASAAGRGMSYNNGKMRSQLFSNYR